MEKKCQSYKHIIFAYEICLEHRVPLFLKTSKGVQLVFMRQKDTKFLLSPHTQVPLSKVSHALKFSKNRFHKSVGVYLMKMISSEKMFVEAENIYNNHSR